jgi:glycerol-3-phosphate dehydrogenase
VISRSKLPIQHAVVCLHPDDQRVLFAIPWGDRAYIGTTDTDYEGDPAEVAATADDVRYLLEACAHYFPDNPIDSDDIIATWAGLRPLIAPDAPEGMSASKVSREHQILVDPKGLVTVAGGKLTTFRRMAAEAVDDTIRLLQLLGCKPNDLRACDTAKHPLPGGVGWPKNDDHEHVASLVAEASEGSLGLESSQALANCYGMRALDIAKLCAARPSMAEPIVPGRPEVIAQIHFGVERELAARLNDVMTRRTQLFYRDVDQGLKVAHRVAEEMGGLLGWDQDRKEAEIERYRVEVGLSRGWRED